MIEQGLTECLLENEWLRKSRILIVYFRLTEGIDMDISIYSVRDLEGDRAKLNEGIECDVIETCETKTISHWISKRSSNLFDGAMVCEYESLQIHLSCYVR